jgi:gluconolactonase
MRNLVLVVAFLLGANISCHNSNQDRETLRTPEEELFRSGVFGSTGGFTRGIEGPAVDLEGNIYATDFGTSGTIGIIEPGKAAQLWLTLPHGANSAAIRFDSLGRMFIADYKLHRLYLVDRKTKDIQIYFEDRTMNQPNDFTISKNGAIYMSDPTWDKNKKGHIWKVNPDKTVVHSKSDLKAPNGIDLSPDETKLYYSDSIDGAVYAYDIVGDQLINRRTLAQYATDTVDGLRTDMAGNIYVARMNMGTIDRLAPDGTLLNRIQLSGKEPSNLAFGGPDGKTMYVTVVDTGSIESFRVDQPGREWALQRGLFTQSADR